MGSKELLREVDEFTRSLLDDKSVVTQLESILNRIGAEYFIDTKLRGKVVGSDRPLATYKFLRTVIVGFDTSAFRFGSLCGCIRSWARYQLMRHKLADDELKFYAEILVARVLFELYSSQHVMSLFMLWTHDLPLSSDSDQNDIVRISAVHALNEDPELVKKPMPWTSVRILADEEIPNSQDSYTALVEDTAQSVFDALNLAIPGTVEQLG